MTVPSPSRVVQISDSSRTRVAATRLESDSSLTRVRLESDSSPTRVRLESSPSRSYPESESSRKSFKLATRVAATRVNKSGASRSLKEVGLSLLPQHLHRALGGASLGGTKRRIGPAREPVHATEATLKGDSNSRCTRSYGKSSLRKA